MKQIIQPALPGQGQLHLFKDGNGCVVMQIKDQAVRLDPRQAYDVAVVLLKQIGAEVNELPKRADDMGGKPLKANLKIV